MLFCEACGRSSDQYIIKRYKGKNVCPKHLSQQWRHGEFLDTTIYDRNDIVVCDGRAYIILKDKNCQEVARAVIDIDDIERCRSIKWYARNTSNGIYAMGSVKGGKKIFLHRYITNYNGTDDVDHINRDTLDNRKENLRIIEHFKNSANNASTGVKVTPAGKFSASICYKGKTIYLGTYSTREEAADVRKKKKMELFGV